MAFHVMGTGSAQPGKTVTNDDLSQFLDTDDEWIVTRTGIKTRQVCTGESTSDLAEAAARRALEDAGVLPEELDLILCTTVSADDLTPSCSCTVQERIGATCPAFDVNAACAGFIFALDVADGYFARGRVRRVLVVSAEKMSRITDWTDRATCVLFGDAAAAVVLGDEGEGPLFTKLTTCGNHAVLNAPSLRGNSPFEPTDPDAPAVAGLQMKGREVFKFAVTSICTDVTELAEKTSVSLDDIDHFVFHQANKRILDAAVERLGLDRAKVAYTIDHTGNVSSACIPLTLDTLNRAGQLKPGELVCLSGFGAGLVVGTMLLRW